MVGSTRRGGLADSRHGRCGRLRPAPRQRPAVSGRPVLLREQAQHDVDGAAAHDLAGPGRAVTPDVSDALEAACRRIGERPASGSPRYAGELDIPGLRVPPAGKVRT